MFRLIKQYAKTCKRYWKVITLLCVLLAIVVWKYSSHWLYIREGAKSRCGVNNAEVNSVVRRNRERLGPLLKIANGQSAKVEGLKQKIKTPKKDMKKTANNVTTEAKATGKPK